MEINEFNYYFKTRSIKNTALNVGVIVKNLGYSKIDKSKIERFFELTKEDISSDKYIENISLKIEYKYNTSRQQMEDICTKLQGKWENYREEYFQILNKVFGINVNRDIKEHTYCYLQLLPINELSLTDNIIYLDASKSEDEIFKNFIIMLTKLMLIKRWNYTNCWNFNTEFDVKNKVWLFAEIAIDAIFANSDLSKISIEPSYKYLYSLKILSENVMEHFRKLYAQVALDDFFTEVYMYIHNNYQTLLHFQHYLY